MWIIRSPYIIVFSFYLILIYPYHKSDKLKESIMLLSLAGLVLFFGFRGSIGDDYQVYNDIYQNISFRDSLDFGPGFVLINLMFKSLNAPFHCFLTFCSIITNLLLVRFLWISRCNVPFAIAVFFAKWGIINEADFIRNVFSIMLFLNSIEFIQKKNAKMYFLYNLIGLTFHVSALIYFPLYWFLDRRISHKTYMGFFAASMVLFILRLKILDFIPSLIDCSRYSWSNHLCEYITSFQNHKATFLFWSESFLSGVAVCFFYKQMTKDPLSLIIVNGFLLNSLCFGFFSAYWMLASRLANLFGFSYWLLYPLIIFKMIKNNLCRLFVFLFMLFFMLQRLINIASLPQWKYYFFSN